MRPPLVEAERVGSIVRGFYDVYNYFGFGFLEAIYSRALELELIDHSHSVRREVSVDIKYKGRHVGRHRMDLIVADRILVEVKSTEHLPGYTSRQLVNYLRATSFTVGLLLHFGPDPKFFRYVHSQKGLVQIDRGWR
jgi:GxxExxY protein